MAATTTKKRSTKKAGGKKRPQSTSRRKMIYAFGRTKTDGRASQRELLGGKGANLADMTSIGLPVPPGFTITTETCAAFEHAGGRLPTGLMDDVATAVRRLERETGKTFGSVDNPLLVSVRSGAAVSMPGMMDTILNLGLNDKVVRGLAALTGNDRFAWDAYRRLINMFGDVVMGVNHHYFEAEFDKIKRAYRVAEDTDVPADAPLTQEGFDADRIIEMINASDLDAMRKSVLRSAVEQARSNPALVDATITQVKTALGM